MTEHDADVEAQELCLGCPPVGYPTDKTRCDPCPRRSDVEAIARAKLCRQGFGFYTDPMESGQDAYDITLEALEEARLDLEALDASRASRSDSKAGEIAGECSICGVKEHDTDCPYHPVYNESEKLRRSEELADKYKWQVRDTCTRAEKAEALLRTQDAKLAAMDETIEGAVISVRGFRAEIAAVKARIAEAARAFGEIEGCFEAAHTEGLEERLIDLDCEVGSIRDLVQRRLLPAHEVAHNARQALSRPSIEGWREEQRAAAEAAQKAKRPDLLPPPPSAPSDGGE